MAIEIRTVKAFRECDAREIYILSKLTFENWVLTIDRLIDSEFELKPIKLTDYYSASDEFKWCYKLKNEEIDTFLEFIKDNYEIHCEYHKENLQKNKAPF